MSPFTKGQQADFVDGIEALPPNVEQDDGQGQIGHLLSGLLQSTNGQDIDPETVKQLLLDEHNRLRERRTSKLSFVDLIYPRSEMDELEFLARRLADAFFNAIRNGQSEIISWLLRNEMVTVDVVDERGRTPLLAAVAAKRTKVVQELLEFGAPPDEFGIVDWRYSGGKDHPPIIRTPLQEAASQGNLSIVKLLMELYHCDDAKIAPDGQLALRLAAENDHRHVVDYLPVRRGGAWRRWKVRHEKAMRRLKYATWRVFCFAKFLVWDVEKFFLWSVPKHGIVLPVVKATKWCWKHRSRFGPWCKSQAKKSVIYAKRLGQEVWAGVKKTPEHVSKLAKGTWKFVSVTLPKLIRRLADYTWDFITHRIPRVVKVTAMWIWSGVCAIGRSFLELLQKVASLLHTAFSAMITFFRGLTLKDIWNGICAVLRVVFISFPQRMWEFMGKFSDVLYDALTALFGRIGEVFWLLLWLVYQGVMFIPKSLWEILTSVWASISAAGHEFVVWVNPKA
ncbi:hypothetical protein AJ80_02299 [Polytolypa hystricis UAMH7299]|uniref:Uncharacterized protein n=1 Tax=Polytolypa hystricis (strain UAMH7299) TaxID=1447883 RepID=A0A2B7YRS9_POLH7|nr:hypothetical protein AJ80_02299 [Polytolypa hystricis UAMH7299]